MKETILDKIVYMLREEPQGGCKFRVKLEFNAIRSLSEEDMIEMRLDESKEKELQIEMAIVLLDTIQAELDAFRAGVEVEEAASSVIITH